MGDERTDQETPLAYWPLFFRGSSDHWNLISRVRGCVPSRLSGVDSESQERERERERERD